MIRLSVIVVLYNEFKLVKKCLRTIYQNSIPNMEVLLIDNSTDKEGHQSVLRMFPKVKYIQNKMNIGFGRAVNVGIKHAKGQFFLILTPDTYLLPLTIKKTVNYIENHIDVGLVGCNIFSTSLQKQRSAAKAYPNLLFVLFFYNIPFYKLIHLFARNYHPSNYSLQDHEHILFPKYVMGAYMLIRKKSVESVGLFDSNFKLYMEDVDLCKRLNDNQWKVVYLPVGGLVSGDGGDWKKTTITQTLPSFIESMYIFFLKHYGKFSAYTAWFVVMISAIISIPYLFCVVKMKEFFKKSSQSKVLLPLWINIIKINLFQASSTVFTNNKY